MMTNVQLPNKTFSCLTAIAVWSLTSSSTMRSTQPESRDLLPSKRRQWFCIPNELKIGIACRACIREKRWRELKAHYPFGLVRRDASRRGGDEHSEPDWFLSL